MDSEFPNSRHGPLFIYLQIVYNQFTRWGRLQDINKSKRPSGFPRFATWEQEIEGETRETRVLAIVTSALFLEAFIFDYIARRDSSNLAKRLDKLEPPNKWLIGTRLVCAPGLKTDSQEYSGLKRLFSARNHFVHYKSNSEGDVFDFPELPDNLLPWDCLDIVGMNLKKLSDLDPDEDIAPLLLRHIRAWVDVSSRDPEFYPVLTNA